MTSSQSPYPDIHRYRLVVFDVDGTLYHQGPVRRRMLLDLLRTGGAPGRLTRLRILRRFRNLREALGNTAPRDFEARLFAQLSDETGKSETELRAMVTDWIERRPLRHLPGARVSGSRRLFEALRANGTAIAAWSDYPVADKLAALGLAADHHIAATDAELGTLKPDPAGLALLMHRLGAAPGETLMVGDRVSRDGAAARAAGVDFLLRTDRAPPPSDACPSWLRDFRPLLKPGT